MSHLLVIGASSGIGLEAVKLALAAGHQVRAFARSADRIHISHENLERFRGDALDPGSVRKALAGVDVVVQALGVPLNLRMVTGPVTLFSEATAVLLPAMHAAGVSRLLAVTGFGAGKCREHVSPLERIPFELVLGRAYRDKDLQEAMIEASGLDWTIVRPGMLTHASASGRYRVLVRPEEWRNGVIARADVAHFLIHEIEAGELVHQAPVLIH